MFFMLHPLPEQAGSGQTAVSKFEKQCFPEKAELQAADTPLKKGLTSSSGHTAQKKGSNSTRGNTAQESKMIFQPTQKNQQTLKQGVVTFLKKQTFFEKTTEIMKKTQKQISRNK